MVEVMLEVRGLTKRYAGTMAVDGLSFVVEPGHVTVFLGPNGSGKSTTMRLILGLTRPDRGEAWVNGRFYAGLPWPLREVGALLETGAVHPGLSAGAHLLALAQTNRIPRARIDEVLTLVGLTDVAGRRIGTFSTGMAQRLGIGTAILGDPAVLLLDEPTNGLDPEGIVWLRSLLKRLAAQGRTVLMSSHLISEMAFSADRVVVIGKGRLIAHTSIAELIARSPAGYVRVRTPDQRALIEALAGVRAARVHREPDGSFAVDGVDAGTIAELAAHRHIVLHELTTQGPSLEAAYLALTGGTVEYRGQRPSESP